MLVASPFLLTTLAGLSTGVGGVLAVLVKPTERMLGFCAGFAGSVMLTVSLADLAPAAIGFYGAYLSPVGCGCAVAGLLGLGMLLALLLGRLLPDEETLARYVRGERAAAMRVALVTGVALLLHNLPEGVLTLFAGISDPQLGLRTALAIALHNIPEGLAVAVPFAYATGSRGKAVAAALCSGVAEPAGAVLAYLFLHNVFNPGFLNGTVVLVAGVMLWVAAAQLLPQALAGRYQKTGAFGLAAGCLVMLIGIAALP
ncbi:MAG: ZIP family metal transporter [Gemmiger sp.]|nr:ZIP family metal transporter [Gemmiger sp.]